MTLKREARSHSSALYTKNNLMLVYCNFLFNRIKWKPLKEWHRTKHAHSLTLTHSRSAILKSRKSGRENSIYWCMYKHYTLEYKKSARRERDGMGKSRTMKRVARTAELIDSADNNKRNDWRQSVPNNNKKLKEFIEKREYGDDNQNTNERSKCCRTNRLCSIAALYKWERETL